MDLVGFNARVGLQDGLLHAGGDRDDRVGVLHGVLLRPRGDVVSSAELLALPRAVWLEGVGGDYVRDAVEAPGQVTAEAGVPGVGVGDVNIGGRVGHPQSGGKRLDGPVGLRQLRIDAVDEDVLFFARGPHAVNGYVNNLAHEAGQLRHVHARPAVDFRRVLL